MTKCLGHNHKVRHLALTVVIGSTLFYWYCHWTQFPKFSLGRSDILGKALLKYYDNAVSFNMNVSRGCCSVGFDMGV